jgi:hypothetical protein
MKDEEERINVKAWNFELSLLIDSRKRHNCGAKGAH